MKNSALPQPIRYMRLAQILEVVPVHAATIWRMVAEKRFPTPIKLSSRVTAWRADEVIAWQNAREAESNHSVK